MTVLAIVLFISPSINQPIRAEQAQSGVNKVLTAQDATSLTKIYRINTESKDMLIHYFGKEAVDKALAQPGCIGLRMYYGMDKNGTRGLILVGVDKKGNETFAGTPVVCPACDNKFKLAGVPPVCPRFW